MSVENFICWMVHQAAIDAWNNNRLPSELGGALSSFQRELRCTIGLTHAAPCIAIAGVVLAHRLFAHVNALR